MSSTQVRSRAGEFTDVHRERRLRMVREQLVTRGIRDRRVLWAMEEMPRELFVPHALREFAYIDSPLPIGFEQTISQPYIVALMLEALDLRREDRVLEVGTGSGYQAALLGLLCRSVVSVEIVPEQARGARELMSRLDLGNVSVLQADGSLGHAAGAPYDAIIIAAATPKLAPQLTQQLAPGGRMILPLGDPDGQELVRARRTPEALALEQLAPCKFVPLRGEGGFRTLERAARR